MLLIYKNSVFGPHNMLVLNRWLIFINISMVYINIWWLVLTGQDFSKPTKIYI